MHKIKILYLFFFLTSSFTAKGADSELTQINKEYEALSDDKKNLYHEVAKQLRCPSCTGLSVLESDASFSLQIRAKVLDLIHENLLEKEIISYFTDRYGLWILREPPKYGFHLLAWIVPFLLLAFGPFAVYSILRKKKKYKEQKETTHKQDLLDLMSKELQDLKTKKP